jgi:hypothetical protein
MHTELVSFVAVAPGAGGAAAAAVTGDSLQIKNTRGHARIVAWWADQQLDGFQQLTFPSGHDTTRGYRARVEVAEVASLMPIGLTMEVQPQETLALTISGSAVAGDAEQGCMLVHYDDLPGVTQRMLTWAQLQDKTEMLTTLEGSMAPAGTGIAYSGSELITVDSDLLRANRDYAILGARVTTQTAALCIRGPDTGNIRIAIPGDVLHPELTINWFGLLARSTGMPMIPIINSGNKGSTTLDVLADENNVAVPFTLFLALLKKGSA